MKNLSTLQKKYEVAVLQNWIVEQQYNRIENLVYSYLTEAPVTSAQQAAPAAPAQQTQPQNIQQAVQQVPKQQLPSLVDQLVGQIAKTNPQAFAELQNAVQSNNVNAINQIIKKYSTQAPVKETTIEEVIIDECIKYAFEIKDYATIQKLHEFVQSDGDVKIITEHINNNCSPDSIIKAYQELYLDGAWDYVKGLGKATVSNIGKGIKAIGKGVANFIGQYGPWAVLGSTLGGPLGPVAVPLIKAALDKWGGTVGGKDKATTPKPETTPSPATAAAPAIAPVSTPAVATAPAATGASAPATGPTLAPAVPASPAFSPVSISSAEVDELRANLNTPGFSRTAELNTRAKELTAKPGVPVDLLDKWQKIKPAGTALEGFNKLYSKALKEFYKHSKSVPIEKANKNNNE